MTPNAAAKTYGNSDPALTGTLSGFLAADGVTATYSRTAGETVAGSPELLPVIYESVDGDWQSQIQADVPEGFVATPSTMNTTVATSQTDVAQFTVVDVGSDWSYTGHA